MDETITSDGLQLAAHLARPAGSAARPPGVVLCHGFPSGPRGAATSAATYPELADRIARAAGWTALTFNFRGTGTSQGDFSIAGWTDDLRAAIGVLDADANGVWIVGVGEGGTLAVCEAARDERVRGIATLGAPIALREWTRDPTRLIAHARRIGMMSTPGYPDDPIAWGRQVTALDARDAARALAPRPLLILHGSADEVVPPSDSRALAEAAGSSAELRLVHAAGHRLRHDPRAVAMLLGWLVRQTP
jgi:pimeloyl-ACP methyl ester carboxylesterase